MSKTDLHFLLLQEVRWKGVGSKLIELDTGDKFEFYWSGYKRKREAGVGILIKINDFIPTIFLFPSKYIIFKKLLI